MNTSSDLCKLFINQLKVKLTGAYGYLDCLNNINYYNLNTMTIDRIENDGQSIRAYAILPHTNIELPKGGLGPRETRYTEWYLRVELIFLPPQLDMPPSSW
ncbi:MAG TPA: hypothetical protein DEG92_09595 [Rikenellaceae bacterium]|nr:hypothetical protein [Rikenellaceae bacterium]